MSPAERARLDRERKAYRIKLDAETNSTQPVDIHGLPITRAEEKAAKHLLRERRTGRISTGFDWEQALADYGYRCAFCGDDERQLTVDHIIPLSRGGGNWSFNIRPLCAPCNRTKESQLDAEFPLGRKI